MTLVLDLTLGLLAASAVLCLVRLAIGRSVADRVVALDTFVVVLVSGIAVAAVRTGESYYVDLILVAALLGFSGTALMARFIESAR